MAKRNSLKLTLIIKHWVGHLSWHLGRTIQIHMRKTGLRINRIRDSTISWIYCGLMEIHFLNMLTFGSWLDLISQKKKRRLWKHWAEITKTNVASQAAIHHFLPLSFVPGNSLLTAKSCSINQTISTVNKCKVQECTNFGTWSRMMEIHPG